MRTQSSALRLPVRGQVVSIATMKLAAVLSQRWRTCAHTLPGAPRLLTREPASDQGPRVWNPPVQLAVWSRGFQTCCPGVYRSQSLPEPRAFCESPLSGSVPASTQGLALGEACPSLLAFHVGQSSSGAAGQPQTARTSVGFTAVPLCFRQIPWVALHTARGAAPCRQGRRLPTLG